MSGQTVRFYEFGPFSIDLLSRVLLRDGKPVPLEPKVFDTLLVLVESHGKVVSKEGLMKAVWGPDTFVEEGGIARNISLLRKTIDAGPEDTQCIATFPKRGYQFVAPVREATEGAPAEPDALSAAPAVAETKTWHGHLGRAHGQDARATAGGTPAPQIHPVAALAAGMLVLALTLGYRFVRPLPAPVVLGYQALTHDGREKRDPLLTDGSRLYFEEKVDGKWVLAVAPTVGGNLSTYSLPSPDVRISDIAPDGSDLVGWEPIAGYSAGTLLVWPVASGTPEVVAGSRVKVPTWSPDRARIAYSDGMHSLFVAGRHGENPQKVATVEGPIDDLRWSPDGRFLVFWQQDPKSEKGAIWEVAAAGGQPSPLLIGGRKPDSVPRWTGDEGHLLFLSGPDNARDIWVRRENCGPLRWRCREPVRITTSLATHGVPLPSRDGKKLFVLSGQYKRELMRYDQKSRTFVACLPTLLAGDADFSPDGNWVVYARLPERTLWRSRTDGSNAVPLTFAGAEAYSPHWSPDGKRIAYMSISAQNQYKACVVAAGGGQPQQVVQGAGEEGIPTWSPDGNFLVFGDTLHIGHASKMAVHLLDLRNHRLSTLPGSKGLWTPRWSPDGRYIAALALGDATKAQLGNCQSLLLYNFRARNWSTLANIWNVASLAWSGDSEYVYFVASGPAIELYRVSIATKRVEHLSSIGVSGGGGGDWIGVAPDGSPLIIGDTRIDEVYALDVQWP
jgi:Tol biopolymer transport system component/DNA-binding winged helix-turn-helix (wHTH) protein